jgi:polysaccharide export outer membrane protein
MQLFFRPPIRQFTVSGLMLLHSSASILTTILVYQLVSQSAMQAKVAAPILQDSMVPIDAPSTITTQQAQASPFPPSQPLPEPTQQRPSAPELVEQARQQLRDRGELSTGDVTERRSASTESFMMPQPSVPPFEAYRLGPQDVVGIVVQRFSDFNVQAVIDPEGNITHPIIGKVQLRGLTIEQAQERIQQAVDRFVINPVVLVSLISQRPRQVTLTGEIFEPGLYPLTQSPQLAAAILAAGGTREDADLRAVTVRRPMSDGTLREETFDLFNPLKTGSPLPNPQLQDGDTIFIPTLKAEDGEYDRRIASRSNLVRPRIVVRVLSYASGGLQQVVLNNGSTFLDALSSAGLNPDRADMNKIALVRFDEQQKKAVSLTLDGKKALAGDISQDVLLRDNDIIVVGRNLVGRITYALNVFTQPFRDVLGFLLFFQQLRDSADDLFGPTR